MEVAGEIVTTITDPHAMVGPEVRMYVQVFSYMYVHIYLYPLPACMSKWPFVLHHLQHVWHVWCPQAYSHPE